MAPPFNYVNMLQLGADLTYWSNNSLGRYLISLHNVHFTMVKSWTVSSLMLLPHMIGLTTQFNKTLGANANLFTVFFAARGSHIHAYSVRGVSNSNN